MFINCHAHVFNAKSVFNQYTLDILLRRVMDLKLHPRLKSLLTKQLQKVIKEAGEYVDEQKFYREIVEKLYDIADFKKLLSKLSKSERLKLNIVGLDGLAEVGADKLIDMLVGVSDRLFYGDEEKDPQDQDVSDFFGFLQIAFQPTIRQVTDNIMSQLPGIDRDAIIALMMDITEKGDDHNQFNNQIEDTSKMVLVYPGRFFPFIAVNTRRPDHYRIMERALTGQGFVGIKLYPSVGYDIDSPEMFRVYQYCETNQIPIIMHCSKFGFRYDETFSDHSSPKKWERILDDYKHLKICFAHFGGDEYMSGLPEKKDAPDGEPWTPVILDLMKKFPNVYADIAYHCSSMNRVVKLDKVDGETEEIAVEKNYFTKLLQYINDKNYGGRILWGTDYFLVRMRLSEKSQWQYFRNHLKSDPLAFKKIATDNARRFLNLPAQDKDISDSNYVLPWNLENYMEYIVRNNNNVEKDKIPSWLDRMIKRKHGPGVQFHGTPLGVAWSYNHLVHRTLYEELKESNQFLGERSFEEAGSIKLGELRYSRELSYVTSGKIKRQQLNGRADHLIDKFVKCGFQARMKQGVHISTTKQRETLAKTLAEPKKYVMDLGSVVDSLFEKKA